MSVSDYSFSLEAAALIANFFPAVGKAQESSGGRDLDPPFRLTFGAGFTVLDSMSGGTQIEVPRSPPHLR